MSSPSPNVAGSFTPAWWIPGAHLQTLWGKLVRRPAQVPTRVERWATPDGDELEIRRLSAPLGASPSSPRLLILHGLEGGIDSHYVQGMLARAARHRWAADVLIFRGCNGIVPTARRLYHSGETSDLSFVVRRLIELNPGQPLVAAGFSLGGNVLLKWLGECGDDVPRELTAAVAVSVPFDLELGARRIEHGFGRVYARSFLRTLRQKALAKLAITPGLFDANRLASARTLYEFDDAVTAPVHGFTDAHDYYSRSSSQQFLAGVRRPALLLASRDDPFLSPEVLDAVALMAQNNSFLTVEFHDRGGHVGFVGGRLPWRPDYYAERRTIEYLSAHLSALAGAIHTGAES